jgi:TolA-binding protein
MTKKTKTKTKTSRTLKSRTSKKGAKKMDEQSIGQKIDAAVTEAVSKLNAKIDELQAVVSELMDRLDALQGQQNQQGPDPVQPPDDSASEDELS